MTNPLEQADWKIQIQTERQSRKIADQAGGWVAEKERCRADIFYWIDNYVWTYNPKLLNTRLPDGSRVSAYLRFKLWPKQVECLEWMEGIMEADEQAVVKKSRDVGASYLFAVKCLHRWLFEDGFKATFGSYQADKVDKLGDPDAIFPKLRIMLYRQPEQLMPVGFVQHRHDKLMQLTNPETGATITGEAGKEMGRGGRSSVYILDEAAHVDNAEDIESALSGNTECVFWVSTANGRGNLFARKVDMLPQERQFQIHWRDDPRKTQEWADKKKAELVNPTAWASQYEIDFDASVDNICIPSLWVRACQRVATLEPRLRASPLGRLGLDVGGGGKGRSVGIGRRGPVVSLVASRQEANTTGTAHWGIALARENGLALLSYDSPGVGLGVSSALELAEDEHGQKTGILVQGVNTGNPPTDLEWPDGRTSKETFGNLKAEIHWLAREAARRTYEHVLALEGDPNGVMHEPSDLLSLPDEGPDAATLAAQLSLVKWFRNEKGKIVIETKAQLTKRGIPSPDYSDAFMLTYVEAPDDGGWYVGQ